MDSRLHGNDAFHTCEPPEQDIQVGLLGQFQGGAVFTPCLPLMQVMQALQ